MAKSVASVNRKYSKLVREWARRLPELPSTAEPARLLGLCKDESGLLVNYHGITLNPFQYKLFQLQSEIFEFWEEHAEGYIQASRLSSGYSIVVDGLDPDRGLFAYFDTLVAADPILGVRHVEPWKLAYGIALGLRAVLGADDLINAADEHPLIALYPWRPGGRPLDLLAQAREGEFQDAVRNHAEALTLAFLRDIRKAGVTVDYESTLAWRRLGQHGDINVNKLFDMGRVAKLLDAARSEDPVSLLDTDIRAGSRLARESEVLLRVMRGESDWADSNAYRWLLLFVGGVFFSEALGEVAALEMGSAPVSRSAHIADERLRAEASTLPAGVSEREAAARFVWEQMVRVPRFQDVASLLAFRAEKGPSILRGAFRDAYREIKTAPVGQFELIGSRVKLHLKELHNDYGAEIDELIEDYRNGRKAHSSDCALTVGSVALNLLAVKVPWLAFVTIPASILLPAPTLPELRDARALLREQERELLRVGCRPISHIVAATKWNPEEE